MTGRLGRFNRRFEGIGGHGEDVAGDGVEYLEGIAGGAYADVGEGGVLHGGPEGREMGREGGGCGGGEGHL